MTPAELYHGAREAVRMARECERSSLDYDKAWHIYMQKESERHRDRAAQYLQSLSYAKRQYEMPLERAA